MSSTAIYTIKCASKCRTFLYSRCKNRFNSCSNPVYHFPCKESLQHCTITTSNTTAYTSGFYYASCTSASIFQYTLPFYSFAMMYETTPSSIASLLPYAFLCVMLCTLAASNIPDKHIHTCSCIYYICDTIYGIYIILNLVNLGYLTYLASPFAYVLHPLAGSRIFAWIYKS